MGPEVGGWRTLEMVLKGGFRQICLAHLKDSSQKILGLERIDRAQGEMRAGMMDTMHRNVDCW